MDKDQKPDKNTKFRIKDDFDSVMKKLIKRPRPPKETTPKEGKK